MIYQLSENNTHIDIDFEIIYSYTVPKYITWKTYENMLLKTLEGNKILAKRIV